MPELPEVETIVRELRTALVGRTIRAVDVRLAKIAHHPVAYIRSVLVGKKIRAVERRAKVILITCSNGYTIVIHLKMSGQMIWVPTKGAMRVGGHPIPGGIHDLPNKYSHVIITMTGGTLYFNDQRQFGYVKVFSADEVVAWLHHQGYGPEPLDRAFTLRVFSDSVKRHSKKRLKPTLLDQAVIAGIGNIYADETCYLAKVRPQRRIGSLTPGEISALHRGLLRILRLSIQKKGTTADAYRTATGDKGSMMPFLNVYGREGKRCKRCRGTIEKVTFVGRGTHYCPKCQR
jgi:formamidopyrimidine-DNA glycosylase